MGLVIGCIIVCIIAYFIPIGVIISGSYIWFFFYNWKDMKRRYKSRNKKLHIRDVHKSTLYEVIGLEYDGEKCSMNFENMIYVPIINYAIMIVCVLSGVCVILWNIVFKYLYRICAWVIKGITRVIKMICSGIIRPVKYLWYKFWNWVGNIEI